MSNRRDGINVRTQFKEYRDGRRVGINLSWKFNATRSSRIWQTRSLVAVDGKEQYTDWGDIEELSSDFTGTWSLFCRSIDGGPKADNLYLYASFL